MRRNRLGPAEAAAWFPPRTGPPDCPAIAIFNLTSPAAAADFLLSFFGVVSFFFLSSISVCNAQCILLFSKCCSLPPVLAGIRSPHHRPLQLLARLCSCSRGAATSPVRLWWRKCHQRPASPAVWPPYSAGQLLLVRNSEHNRWLKKLSRQLTDRWMGPGRAKTGHMNKNRVKQDRFQKPNLPQQLLDCLAQETCLKCEKVEILKEPEIMFVGGNPPLSVTKTCPGRDKGNLVRHCGETAEKLRDS